MVPDTNALMNRSFSAFSFVLGHKPFLNTYIRIPRLTVFEMERIANEAKGSGEDTEKKRKVMHAATELLFIKQNSILRECGKVRLHQNGLLTAL